jgi:hypothetical protein
MAMDVRNQPFENRYFPLANSFRKESVVQMSALL